VRGSTFECVDPLAPRPPFQARAADALRAGAFVAGGSLAALAAAISVGAYHRSLQLDAPPPQAFEVWLSTLLTSSTYRVPLVLWLAGTLASIALAVRFGHPGAPQGWRAYVGRTWSAAVLGPAIAAAVVIPAVLGLPSPQMQDDVAVFAFLTAGALPILAAAVSLRAVRRAAPEIPDGPVTFGPAPASEAEGPVTFARTFALAATGPPVTAEETERKTPALEVRVLWGGDLLRVFHLEPPRSFHVGEEGADFAVDAERLGARRVPVVVVEGGGVSVVAPRGATGAIVTTTGRVGSVERAVEEGLGEPFEGATPGTRIPLAEGARVSLTLPSRVTGTAYRATSGGEHDPPTAPLVLDITLVNAGRVVGRGALRGSARLLASTSLVAAAAAGGLHVAATEPPPDEDDTDSAAVYLIQTTLASVQAREDEEQEEQPSQPSCRHGCRPGLLLGTWDDAVDPEALCETLRGDPSALAFFGPTCEPYWGVVLGGVGDVGGGVRLDSLDQDFMRNVGTVGGWPGAPSMGQGFGTGHGQLGRARKARPSHVGMGALHVNGRLPPEVVQRVVRQRFPRFRSCYENGLRNNPNLQGRVLVHFAIGRDGALTSAFNAGSDMPDRGVVSCVLRAFGGLRFPPPEAGVVWVEYPIRFDPGG
jgi:hypothetical protein